MGQQFAFLTAFVALAAGLRRVMPRLPQTDRWAAALVWLLLSALGADWCGLHYMVGAFLAGTVLDADWFEQGPLDTLRQHVLLVLMPVFFLSTGLRTQWELGGIAVFVAAALLLVLSVVGKLAGVRLAGWLLGWPRREARVIGWLLQTKALIMIVFANVLLDKQLISSETFTDLAADGRGQHHVDRAQGHGPDEHRGRAPEAGGRPDELIEGAGCRGRDPSWANTGQTRDDGAVSKRSRPR